MGETHRVSLIYTHAYAKFKWVSGNKVTSACAHVLRDPDFATTRRAQLQVRGESNIFLAMTYIPTL